MLPPAADAPGVIPGIVGAVVVAVAGAISSFIAYQKKKLCFKENGKARSASAAASCLADWKTVLSLKGRDQTRAGTKQVHDDWWFVKPLKLWNQTFWL